MEMPDKFLLITNSYDWYFSEHNAEMEKNPKKIIISEAISPEQGVSLISSSQSTSNRLKLEQKSLFHITIGKIMHLSPSFQNHVWKTRIKRESP